MEPLQMQLSAKQVSDFDKDGYLIFRNLFSEQEVAILREEASRIAKLDTECVIREGVSGTPKKHVPHARDRRPDSFKRI